MNVSLPTELVPFVDNLVATGSYSTPEDVVRHALSQMRDRRAKFEELKASIDEAVAELETTGGMPFDPEEIKRLGRERLAAYRRQNGNG